jgi:hypothetical protein
VLVKKTEGKKSVSSGKAPRSRSCSQDAHHDLYTSIERRVCADQLDRDPMDFSVHFEARIKCLAEDREDGPVVGEINAVWIEVERALRMEQSLYDVFDSDQDSWDFYEAFTQKHAGFIEAIEYYTLGGSLKSDVLLLTGIQIEPPHRGKRLGLQATASLIEQFRDHCALVICQPFPMQFGPIGENAQWQRRYGPGLGGDDQKTSTSKLKDYGRRLGFREMGKTRFMLLVADEFEATEVFDERQA